MLNIDVALCLLRQICRVAEEDRSRCSRSSRITVVDVVVVVNLSSRTVQIAGGIAERQTL